MVIGIVLLIVSVIVFCVCAVKSREKCPKINVINDTDSKGPSLFSCFACGLTGIFTFLFWRFPFIVGKMQEIGYRDSNGSYRYYDGYYFGSSEYSIRSEKSYSFDGYDAMDLWDLGGAGIASSIFQIVILFLVIAMIAVACLGIFNFFSGAISVSYKKMKNASEALLIAYIALNAFAMLLSIGGSYDSPDIRYIYNYDNGTAVGPIVILVFGVIMTVAASCLPKWIKFDAMPNSSRARMDYVCTSCGKKAKFGAAFCTNCGGKVEGVLRPYIYYECSNCEKKSGAGVNFCAQCGGSIVRREVMPDIDQAEPQTTAEPTAQQAENENRPEQESQNGSEK